MLSDLARAFAMFSDRSVRRTFLLSLGVTVLLLAAMFPAADALLASAGATGYWWLDKLLEIAGLFGTAVLALFLFPTAVAAVLGFLLDAVVEATERRHFPALPPAEGPSFLTNLVHSLGFALLVLGLNVLAFWAVQPCLVPVHFRRRAWRRADSLQHPLCRILTRRAARGAVPLEIGCKRR